MITEAERFVVPVKAGRGVSSLVWEGNELVDWVRGGTRYRLDGSSLDPRANFAYRFDRAVAFPDGRFAVIYEQRGTKGLILKQGKILREIDRSFYCAGAYEYPVVLHRLRDGRDVIVHCPDEYCKLEVEEIESGQRLTAREGKPLDFFHSRLQVSPDGLLLLDAGWIWHPLDELQVFDIEAALSRPESLDENHGLRLGETMIEAHAAAFSTANRLIVAAENYNDEAHSIGVYDLSEGCLVSAAPLDEPAGTLMPVDDMALGFFEHPKLIDVRSGKVIRRWPEIDSGSQNSSIIGQADAPPPMALDPQNRRFAVAGPDAITVVQLG